MRSGYLYLGFLLLALAVACSSPDTTGQVRVAAQDPESGFGDAVVHDTLRVGDTVYVSDSRFEQLLYGSSTGPTEELPLPGVFPQQLIGPHTAGETGEVWIVAGDGTGGVSLRSYRDSNQDGLIDPSTVTVLFSGDRPDVTRATAFDPASGSLYLFECGTGNVYRARDTNADNVPDTLDTVPFVDGTWFPGMSEPRYLEIEDPETGGTLSVPAGLSSYASGLTRAKPQQVTLVGIGDAKDTDGNGVADEIHDYFEPHVAPPVVLGGRLVAGMHRVPVAGTYGATLELREVDDQGTVLGTLDTIIVDSGSGWFEPAAELEEGALLVVHDTTNALSSPVFTVLPEAIVVERPTAPISAIEGVATTITIAGANLDLLDDIKLTPRDDDPEDLSLAFTVSQDARSVDIDVPALDTAWVGLVSLWFLDDDQDPDPLITCDVCPSGGGGGGSGG